MATCTKCKAQNVGVDHIRQCWKQHYADGGGDPATGTFTNTEFGGEAPERTVRGLFGISFEEKDEAKREVKAAVGRWPRWNRDGKVWEIEATQEEWDRIPDQWKEKPDLEDGIYLHEETYYMVYHNVNGNGMQLAKKFVLTPEENMTAEAFAKSGNEPEADDEPLGEWVPNGASPLKRLKPEMKLSPEDAARFGQVYGWCGRCGRTLTNEDSKKAGIGPVCAAK
ncbi:hypothetical protein SEA_LITTLEFELLA_44 [Gordonia phage LittleFella]|nr:hypothetical protein SEA_LITTLEFELLA_44 [Gordonia phage LittleFella]